MFMRFATLAALSFALVSPALADCREDLAKLEQPAVTADTGAATDKSGMPVTKHQEEVMPDKQGTSGETTGATSGKVEALTPHQKQVTGMTADKSTDLSHLMADARKLAETGDEEGCMRKVGELKDAMGMKGAGSEPDLLPRITSASLAARAELHSRPRVSEHL